MRSIGTEAHEIKFSMDVSIGLVLSDLRKDARPGVRAKDVDGMTSGMSQRGPTAASVHNLSTKG